MKTVTLYRPWPAARFVWIGRFRFLAGLAALATVTMKAADLPRVLKTVAVTQGDLVLAPYVWKPTGSGDDARIEAMMPGAYLKAVVRGTSSVALLVDGTANAGVAPAALPILDFSVDGGEFSSVRLRDVPEVYALPLAGNLDPAIAHRVEVVFRSASLQGRWSSAQSHLRIAGLQLGPDGTLAPCPRLPGNAIVFGDSITEGVAVDGPGPYYANLMLNNARVTWAPLVCTALRCEYGQLGTGGHGMVHPLEIPPLPGTWDRYDSGTSRLTTGHLLPEPDYIFCLLGTNDREVVKSGESDRIPNISLAYTDWLAAVRAASPHSLVACITPPLGLHAAEIAAAVEARRDAGDANVVLVDTAPLREKFLWVEVDATGLAPALKARPTQLANDGVHPSEYGNGMLAAFVVAEIFRQRQAVTHP